MSITDNFPPAEKSSSDVGEIERKMLMASSETYLLYFVPLVVTTIHHASSPREEAGTRDLLPPCFGYKLLGTNTSIPQHHMCYPS